MAPPYTIANIREIVSRNLGEGRIRVELNNEHYTRGIDAACKMLARYRPEYGFKVYPVAIGGNKTLLNIKNLINVVDVSFFAGTQRYEEAPYYTRWVDRNMELADMKDTQKAFNDEPEYYINREYNEVTEQEDTWLYTQFTRSSFVDTFAHVPTLACCQFTWNFDASDDKQVGVSRIPYDMRQWVEEYATAACREIMGQVRSKFGGVPGATDGALLPNDGARQVEMAREDKRRLEDDMKSRQRQLPLIIN